MNMRKIGQKNSYKGSDFGAEEQNYEGIDFLERNENDSEIVKKCHNQW